MADIAVYLDGSGLAGTVGSASLWADVVNWQRGLNANEYPTLSHLVDNGWGDELDVLQAELEEALSGSPPASAALADGLHQLLDLVGSRTDGDSAVAVALANAEDDEEGQVGNEMSHRDIDQAINQMLAEKYTKPGAGAGGNDLSSRPADCWPVDVYDDYFVYRMTPPSGSSKFYRQDYSVDENDQVSFDGDPEEVVRVTDYVPIENAGGEDVVNEDGEEVGNESGEVTANGKRLPSGRLGISPAKACQILKDGEVRGKPLSQAQRGLFGVICGRRGKKGTTENAEGEEHECGCVGPCQCIDGEEMDASETAEVMREALTNAGNPYHDSHSGQFTSSGGQQTRAQQAAKAGAMESWGAADHAQRVSEAKATAAGASKNADNASKKAEVSGRSNDHRKAVDAHLGAHDAHMDVVVKANEGDEAASPGYHEPSKDATQHARKAETHRRKAQRHAETANMAETGNSEGGGLASGIRNSVREALSNGADARGVFASLKAAVGSEQVRNAIKEMVGG